MDSIFQHILPDFSQLDKCSALKAPFVGYGIENCWVEGIKNRLVYQRKLDHHPVLGRPQRSKYGFLFYAESRAAKMVELFSSRLCKRYLSGGFQVGHQCFPSVLIKIT